MDTTHWQTIGHEQAKRALAAQLATKSAAHAYVFLGPEGVGKRTLAEEFGSLVAGKQNVLRLDATSASVQELREFLARLALKPLSGDRQVAIIDGAEHMSTSFGNALLKTLEEPTPAAMLVLIAANKSLLPTIMSRARVVLFGALSRDELDAVVKAHGIAADTRLTDFASGSAAVLVGMAKDESFYKQYTQWNADWNELRVSPLWRRLGLIASWLEADDSNFRQRLMAWFGAAQSSSADATTRAGHLRVLAEAWDRLGKNANKKMILEYICLYI